MWSCPCQGNLMSTLRRVGIVAQPTGMYCRRVVRGTAAVGAEAWRSTPLSAGTKITITAGDAAAGPDFGVVPVAAVPLNFAYRVKLARHFN